MHELTPFLILFFMNQTPSLKISYLGSRRVEALSHATKCRHISNQNMSCCVSHRVCEEIVNGSQVLSECMPRDNSENMSYTMRSARHQNSQHCLGSSSREIKATYSPFLHLNGFAHIRSHAVRKLPSFGSTTVTSVHMASVVVSRTS